MTRRPTPALRLGAAQQLLPAQNATHLQAKYLRERKNIKNYIK